MPSLNSMRRKETGIIFMSHLAEQIALGVKTETRRLIQPAVDDWMHRREPRNILGSTWGWFSVVGSAAACQSGDTRICRYGKEGDWLWVREKWRVHRAEKDSLLIEYGDGTKDWRTAPHEAVLKYAHDGRWKTGRFMPKYVCRLWLKILEVRPERVQAMTGRAAVAEGMVALPQSIAYDDLIPELRAEYEKTALGLFRQTWDRMHGEHGWNWDRNPWVWVVRFQKKARFLNA